jgi:hypothetical protein
VRSAIARLLHLVRHWVIVAHASDNAPGWRVRKPAAQRIMPAHPVAPEPNEESRDIWHIVRYVTNAIGAVASADGVPTSATEA